MVPVNTLPKHLYIWEKLDLAQNNGKTLQFLPANSNNWVDRKLDWTCIKYGCPFNWRVKPE